MSSALVRGHTPVCSLNTASHSGIGPNEVSVSHPDVVQSVLGAKGLRKGPCEYSSLDDPRAVQTELQLGTVYSGRQLPNGTTSLLNVADPVEHSGRRRTWNRGMSSTALKDYEHIVKNKVQELMDGLSQRQSQDLDISQWMSFFGYVGSKGRSVA